MSPRFPPARNLWRCTLGIDETGITFGFQFQYSINVENAFSLTLKAPACFVHALGLRFPFYPLCRCFGLIFTNLIVSGAGFV